MMRSNFTRIVLVSVSAMALALAGACSLNPQPIPPGFDELDAATGDASRGSGADNGDAEAPPNATTDAATQPEEDAGDAAGFTGDADASDAGDASDAADSG